MPQMARVSRENITQLVETAHDICQFIFGISLAASLARRPALKFLFQHATNCGKAGWLPHFNMHLHLRHAFLIIFITEFTYFKCRRQCEMRKAQEKRQGTPKSEREREWKREDKSLGNANEQMKWPWQRWRAGHTLEPEAMQLRRSLRQHGKTEWEFDICD